MTILNMVSGGVLDPNVFGLDDSETNGGVPSFLDRRKELEGAEEATNDVEHAAPATGEQHTTDEDNVEWSDVPDTSEGAGDASGVHGSVDGAAMVEHAAAEFGGGDSAEHAGADMQQHIGGELDPQAAAEYAAEASEERALDVVSGDEAVPEHTPIGHNAPPPEPLSKEQMLKDFNRDVASYGKDSGKGAAALPRLGLRVVRAAYDGLISNEKPKDGSKSDATRIYEAYAANDSKHAEHTKGGMKANAAKLNALIGLGCMTTVDGVDVASRAVAIREKLEGADAKPKALFAGLVDVARAQLAQDTALTDAQIEAAFGKVEKEKTVAGEWEAIRKKVEGLVTGEGPQGLRDDSDRAMAIYSQIDEHIKNFAVDKERTDKIGWLMERGMTRAQAEEFASK